MAHSVDVIISARDRASKKFGVISTSAAAMGTALKSVASITKSAFTKVFQIIKRATVVLSAAFLAMSGASVKWAMDAVESENLFEVSMGKAADATRKWSEEIAKTLGLNAYELRKMVSTFNVMLNSMGIGIEKSSAMSKELTELAQDMASFYNLKPEEAFQKLQAGITGEIEPLKRLGILVNENTIKQWALSKGIISGKQQLSEQQKVMARYNVILQQTQKAQGDLARTQDSATNIFRSLRAQIKMTAIDYGMALMPAVTSAGKSIKNWLAENRDDIRRWGDVTASYIILVKDAFVELARYMKQDWRGAMGWVFDSFLEMLQAAFKSAVLLAIAGGKGIWRGVKEGILGGNERAIERMTEQLYRERRKNAAPGTVWEGLGPPMHRTAIYYELRKQAEAEIQKEAVGGILGGTMTAIKETWKEAFKNMWADLPEKTQSGIEKAYAEHLKRLEKAGKGIGRVAGAAGAPETFGLADAIKEAVRKAGGGLSPLSATEGRLLTFAPGTRFNPIERNTRDTVRTAKDLVKHSIATVRQLKRIRDQLGVLGIQELLITNM